MSETAYELEGTVVEACNCGVVCPCCVGEDPDGETVEGAAQCDAIMAFHIDHGTIGGVDVSGLSVVDVTTIPGNVKAGNWRVIRFIDEAASDEQAAALERAYAGELGGPLKDLAALVGEVVETLRAPISYDLHDGDGTLRVGDAVSAAIAPLRTASGIAGTVSGQMSPISGAATACVSKASSNSVALEQYGFSWAYSGTSATQAPYSVSHKA